MTASVLVTGGNKGIGYQLCKRLAKSGFNVLLGARDEELGNEAAQNIHTETGKNVTFVPIDITNETSVQNLTQNINKYTNDKPLDILINNAGIASKGSAFNQEIARNTLYTNYFGTKRITDTLLEKNLIANGGKIINVSSRAGQLGSTPTKSLSPLLDNADRNKVDSIANDFIDATSDPDNVEARGFPKNTYKVSKATLNAYGRALAKEQSGRVHVYNYCPGWCQTDMGGANAIHTAEDGADTGVWLATEDPKHLESGEFYGERKKIQY